MSIETPQSIIKAVQQCLNPIARLCIYFGLDFRQLSELMKVAYVRIAREEFKVNRKQQTDSRIALLTGVHRKDVRRIQQLDDDAITKHKRTGLVAKLISTWLATPELTDVHGAPIAIPKTPQPGLKISFTDLGKLITNDLHPRALLDECVNRGVLKVDAEDMVHLIEDALIPSDSLDEKAHFFGQTVHDHLAASCHNLMDKKPAFFDRFVWEEGLTAEDVRKVAEAAEKAAMNAIKQINSKAFSLKKDSEEAHYRIHFGAFFYSSKIENVEPVKEDKDE